MENYNELVSEERLLEIAKHEENSSALCLLKEDYKNEQCSEFTKI